MKKLFIQLIAPVLLLLWSTCANIKTPSGGPKDKRPPKLVSSKPAANQINYKSVSVELTFNESIKLNNPKEEIIISPSPAKDIEFTTKGNKVFILPKTPWKDSTTYSILFREGVQDITESNSPTNLKLAFSTGPWIDSLMLSGNAFDLIAGQPKEKITVAVYSADTFDIFNDTPSYFTKTDKRGNFTIENIRAGRYLIYAFEDKNKNLKVESRAEMYGFLVQPIDLKKNIDTLQLGMVHLDSKALKLSTVRNIGNVTRLRFSKYLTAYTVQSVPEVVNAFNENETEITLWNPEGPDSTEIRLSAADSLDNSLDTIIYIKRSSIKPVIEKFTTTLGNPSINPENSQLITQLKFSKPLLNITLDSLYIQLDSTSRFPITKEDITYNPQRKEISIAKELNKKLFGADQDPRLTLLAKRNFAISMDGDTSKAMSAPITIFWPEENGTLSLQVNTKKKGYIIQLLNNSTRQMVAQIINTNKLTARNIPPAEYQIRIIIDSNQNKKWDAGNIFKRIEPEKIFYYHTPEGTATFPIRANWEVGPIQITF